MTEHTGGMIAWVPRERDADRLTVIDVNAEPAEELHVTIAYLGDDVTGASAEQAREWAQAVWAAASDLGPQTVKIFGHAVFNPDGDEPCAVYLVGDNDTLTSVRAELADVTTQKQHSPYIPHITAGYGVPMGLLSYTGEIVLDRLRLAIAGDVVDFPLTGKNESKESTVDELETKREIPQSKRDKLAKTDKATDDGSYPIESIKDLQNAISAYGHAKEEDRPKIRAHITRNAKRLNATNMLPKNWSETPAREKKAASADPRAMELKRWWAFNPKGRAKWKPGAPGDFNRLVRELKQAIKSPMSDQMLKGLAANIHKMALGAWPGRENGKKSWSGGAEHKALCAPDVDRMGDWVEMQWFDAAANPAEMIQLKAAGDWTDFYLVQDAVSSAAGVDPAANLNHAVPLLIRGPGEQKAAGVFIPFGHEADALANWPGAEITDGPSAGTTTSSAVPVSGTKALGKVLSPAVGDVAESHVAEGIADVEASLDKFEEMADKITTSDDENITTEAVYEEALAGDFDWEMDGSGNLTPDPQDPDSPAQTEPGELGDDAPVVEATGDETPGTDEETIETGAAEPADDWAALFEVEETETSENLEEDDQRAAGPLF